MRSCRRLSCTSMPDQEASARTRSCTRPLYMAMPKPTTATITIRTMIRAITGSRVEFCRVPYRARYHRRESRSQCRVVGGQLLRRLEFELHRFRSLLGGGLELPFANYVHGGSYESRVAAHDLGRFHLAAGLDRYQQLHRSLDVQLTSQIGVCGQDFFHNLAGGVVLGGNVRAPQGRSTSDYQQQQNQGMSEFSGHRSFRVGTGARRRAANALVLNSELFQGSGATA